MMKCKGCGAVLQTKNAKQSGYIKDLNYNLCVRCFRLRNYNEFNQVEMTNQDFKKIIEETLKTDCLSFLVVDLFDFDSTYLSNQLNFKKDQNFYLIVNKRDLLVKSVKEHKIINWVHEYTKLPKKQIIITSAIKNQGIDEIIKIIHKHKFNKNFFFGVTNTGKTTLINHLISHYEKTNLPTVSHYPGTTLNTIAIKLNEKQEIIDSPGLINKSQLIHYLDPKSYKQILPQSEIRPKTYQLNAKQTLFLTGFCQIDFISGSMSSVTINVSNQIKIHRTKLANSEEFRKRHLGHEIIVPPTISELSKITAWETKVLEINKNKTDIIISGLGFVTINEVLKPLTIQITTPQNIQVTTRKSII